MLFSGLWLCRMHLCPNWKSFKKAKKRTDYAFRCQFAEKPSSILGCPVGELHRSIELCSILLDIETPFAAHHQFLMQSRCDNVTAVAMQ